MMTSSLKNEKKSKEDLPKFLFKACWLQPEGKHAGKYKASLA